MHDIRTIKKVSDLTELSNYIENLRTNPKLVYLFLELTNWCNLSCLHCGSSCLSNGERIFLDKKVIKKVLLEISIKYDSRNIIICVTGGEPLLYPWLFEIMSYARDLGYRWGMTTNGTLLTKNVIKQLIKSGLGNITVSLDGLEKDHNLLRNNKNSYLQTMKGISLLSEAKMLSRTQISTVVSKLNISKLNEFYSEIEKIGCKEWRLINIEPIGRALVHSDMMLDSSDYKVLFDFIKDKKNNKKSNLSVTYGCSHYVSIKYEKEIRDNYFICGAGILVGSILSNGDIFSCLDIKRRPELIQGNVYKDSFVDVWENKFKVYRTDRTDKCAKCQNCDDRRFCFGDSMHTWDFDNNRPMICIKNMMELMYEKDIIKQFEPLWGVWKVEEKIGSGRFTDVYSVSHHNWDKKYEAAVKVISIPQGESEIKEAYSLGADETTIDDYFIDSMEILIKEMSSIYSLKGDNSIISYEDHWIHKRERAPGWHIFIRMELLKPLKEYYINKVMRMEDVVKMGIQICGALEACESKNIIHRDIKDTSIFVTNEGDFKLGNFGSATQIGTPNYMAPEMYKGETFDSTVDIYSLGLLLYKLLNHNRFPFTPEYPNPVTSSSVDEALILRSSGEKLPVLLDVSDELMEIILKACEYNPRDRFQSSLEMKNALISYELKIIDLRVIEHHYGITPNGGCRAEAHYLNYDHEYVSKEIADIIIIKEFDSNDEMIYETIMLKNNEIMDD